MYILDANTVVDPGAMVVKPIDTFIADVAVPAPRRLNDFAFRTETTVVELFKQLHEVKTRISSD